MTHMTLRPNGPKTQMAHPYDRQWPNGPTCQHTQTTPKTQRPYDPMAQHTNMRQLETYPKTHRPVPPLISTLTSCSRSLLLTTCRRCSGQAECTRFLVASQPPHPFDVQLSKHAGTTEPQQGLVPFDLVAEKENGGVHSPCHGLDILQCRCHKTKCSNTSTSACREQWRRQ